MNGRGHKMSVADSECRFYTTLIIVHCRSTILAYDLLCDTISSVGGD